MQISSNAYNSFNSFYTAQNSHKTHENDPKNALHDKINEFLSEHSLEKQDFSKKIDMINDPSIEKINKEKAKNNSNELTPDEEQMVQKLQARDQEVRAHEAAHMAAGAGVVTGGPSFTYQKGPDGKQYAIGGEVPIDTSPEATPEATIAKARKIKTSATAPANPSGQDLQVASTAAIMEMKASMEIASKKSEEQDTLSNKNQPNYKNANFHNNHYEPLDVVA